MNGGFNCRSSAASPLLSRHPGAQYVVIEQICATLWSNDVLLSKSLRIYDLKASGAVTPDEFKRALESMSEALTKPFNPFTALEVEKLVGSLPLDVNGLINYKEVRHISARRIGSPER